MNEVNKEPNRLDDLKDKIRKFLNEFKKIASESRSIYVISRRENIDSLAQLGLTTKNRYDEIMMLSVADYCKGPEPDKDKPGEVWVFGKQIRNEEVYIKLKIAEVREKKIVKCLSFHKASYPIYYPYKKKLRKGGNKR